jgi:hypothetical protein
MNKTLWKIKESLQENINNEIENDENDENKVGVEDESNNENSNLDELYNNLINNSKNSELLKYIEEYDPIIIKNILDSYALTKIVLVKQSNCKEFNICSYNVEGLDNIKMALDYKSYDKYLELDVKYDIVILYLSAGKYSLTVKQKTPIEEDITDICNYLLEEIKSRCMANNVIFNIGI